MWPGAMVWTEQMLKSPIIAEYSTGHSMPDHWGLQREHLSQGGFAHVVLIHWYLHVLSLLLLFTKAKDFENLVPFKLSTGGTMWLGSTKWRAEQDNTMRTPVWTELANGVKIKLCGALVAHWALCVWCLSWLRTQPPKNSFTKKCQDRLKWRHCGAPVLLLSLFPFSP